MAAIKPKIKPAQTMQMEKDYPEKTWSLLKDAIHQIHKHNASCLSFEELYRNAYNMVLHKFGDHLYDGLTSVVNQHLRETSVGVIEQTADEEFLKALDKAWKEHKVSMLMIRDILMYMDRSFVKVKGVRPVYELGLLLFCNNLARHEKIKDRLLGCIMKLIARERKGEVVEKSILQSLLRMLVDVGISSRQVYEEDFEKNFLEDSALFYKTEGREFISTSSCGNYMEKVEQRLKEEQERVRNYLDANTEVKIRDIVERELISEHMNTLVEMENSGVVPMLRDDKFEDLKRMFNLFSRVNGGHILMRKHINDYIVKIGTELVEEHKKKPEAAEYVQSLLNLKAKYDAILETSFGNDKAFQNTINKAFETFMNSFARSPEFISIYIDGQLKKGAKGSTEQEIEVTLDKTMVLFRFLNEKDLFEKYYKQHLAKRLLFNRSTSDDSERNMIQKLKLECGYQFTSKLEGMFTDMRLSGDTMNAFKEKTGDLKQKLGGIELSVNVLTSGFWPSQATVTCNLPREITNCCEVFKRYYLAAHTGRRLTWQTNMGQAEVRLATPTLKHEFVVSTHQMVVLDQFNNGDSFTYTELRQATEMTEPELKRCLQALAMGKTRIITTNAAGKDIEPEDRFMFNHEFSSKLYKVKIMAVSSKSGDTEPEIRENREKLDDERKHLIEAAIVRVMKARKTLDHTNLIAEVTQQLSARFMPKPDVIKKRIESLIEREYLERGKNNRKEYNYLA